jgi:hypothetical protein
VKAQPSLGVRKARREANALLRRMRAPAGKALDVEAIANLVRLRVERGELDGAAARLVRVGQHGTIRINARVTDVGSQRFSVAHELGHYVLGHATPEADEPCDGPTVHGYVDRGEECEANAFAAELLMPEPHLRRRCEVSPVSLGPARAIAADFEVSLMAAALRFVELTSERCALVFARDRRVAWASRSETFAPFLERGRLVDRASVAIDWFERGRVHDGCQPVPGDAWIDHDEAGDVEIFEEAVPVPTMGGVMSLLWIPERAARPFDRA